MTSLGEPQDDRRVQAVAAVERVIGVDPTAVWSLVADPTRVSEWAGVATVGYMGTELPKAGQAVFIRIRRWHGDRNARRVEIEDWDAGAGYRCVIESARSGAPIQFEVSIKPEVVADGISTKVRLVQRMESGPTWVAVRQRYLTSGLTRKLDRIEQAATG